MAPRPSTAAQPLAGAQQCRRKFLRYFPRGFSDRKYIDWERGYKWSAHLQWNLQLSPAIYRDLLERGQYQEIAVRALRIESRTNLLFSFEKMALRDATRGLSGAKFFAEGLYAMLQGAGDFSSRWDSWIETVGHLPRIQTRVLTWPAVTIFPFLAQPSVYFFCKPKVTKQAALAYQFPLEYKSRPSWETYCSILSFAKQVRADVADLAPMDFIDLQSFIWVQGSAEYP